MATVINIEEADDALADLYDRAAAGEEIVMARPAGPKLRLIVDQERSTPKRRAGTLKGLIHLDDGFFDPLPEEELRAWEGA